MTTPTPRSAPGSLPPAATLTALADQQVALAALLDRADPDRPVPGCGRWRVRDLVEHLVDVHRWAAAQASCAAHRTGTAPGDDELADAYRAAAAHLHRTLTVLGPDAPAETLDGSGRALFWWRRQLHETLVHRADLASALGERADAPAVVWADTVAEVVDTMAPRQVRLDRMTPLVRPVGLHLTDTGDRFTLGGPDGARVVVRGPARAIALLLWRRLPADAPDLTVDGDPTALHDALARPLTP